MAEDFTELRIWREAIRLTVEIYKITTTYPEDEKYGLTSQTRRSANSSAGNIAESCGRFYYNDKIRVLYQARGEIMETESHLIVANKIGYLTLESCNKLVKDYQKLTHDLNSYIKSIKKS
jgi:four helix bundle protein